MGGNLVVSKIIRTFVLSVIISRRVRQGGLSQRVYSNLLIYEILQCKARWSILGPHLVNDYRIKLLKIFDINNFFIRNLFCTFVLCLIKYESHTSIEITHPLIRSLFPNLERCARFLISIVLRLLVIRKIRDFPPLVLEKIIVAKTMVSTILRLTRLMYIIIRFGILNVLFAHSFMSILIRFRTYVTTPID